MTQPIIRSNRLANILVATVLVAVPFHAFVTVWGQSLVGHYTLLRLWDDAILAITVGIAIWWLVHDGVARQWFLGSTLVRLIAAYAGLSLLLGLLALVKHDVTAKALAYGLLVNLRFLVWFLAVLLTAQRSAWLGRNWPRLLLASAIMVIGFAILQYMVLPHNFLAHFGYNASTTIAPIETINHNAHYIRVQSTLRGANPLGAYLVVVLSALGALYLWGRRRVVVFLLAFAGLFALYASGSRSAWIGTLLAAAVIGVLRLRSRRQKLLFGGVLLLFVLVAGTGYLALKNNASLENAVLHTQKNSSVAVSSNAAHASAQKAGLRDVARQPFGAGPGTAGPASVYNAPLPSRIADDYYIQIAQETGWLGLALFVSILLLVGRELYERARGSRLALALLASLIGLSFVNLLSHAWVDDTLAYVWWGLAGIALARPQKDVHAVSTD